MENIGSLIFYFLAVILFVFSLAFVVPIAAYIAIKMSEFLKLNNDFGDE
nr:MAG TPA: hypothetical protein [Caudoviricetes sp.]DAK26878.1 MAG TPA: hypothetical protein [Caudoviricetes sp.]